MTYHGTIKGGVVILEGGVTLPEGTKVAVQPVDEASLQSLREGLLGLAGSVTGLPEDFAENHDHYIHGAPKK